MKLKILEVAEEVGIKQGIEQGIEKVAANLLIAGDTTQKVASVTGLSARRINALKKHLLTTPD